MEPLKYLDFQRSDKIFTSRIIASSTILTKLGSVHRWRNACRANARTIKNDR